MNQPEWRQTEADAILDGDSMVETGQWANYKIDITYKEPWEGNRIPYYKAVKARKANGQ